MLCLRPFCSLIRRVSTTVTAAPEENLPYSEACMDVGKSPPAEDCALLTRSEARFCKYALLLCYHGANYHGIQFNSYRPSIEQKLFEALNAVGYSVELIEKCSKYGLQYSRASRTDAGVSALRQVVGINLPETPDIEKINSFLPPDIRLLGAKRATRGFDAQKQCDFRSYCYIMPTFALCKKRSRPNEIEKYRVDSETLSNTNLLFKMFEGTHKFHNYTEKRDKSDRRSIREIISCSVSEPFLKGDLEMVELHISGSSFMLHQIRRMVGMTIAVVVERFPMWCFHDTFVDPFMPTPTAPALGLMLEKQYFEYYNKKFSKYRDPLTWEECDHLVQKFKLEKVVPHIVQVEIEEKSMLGFLDLYLRKHSFKPRNYSSRLLQVENWNKYNLEELDAMFADNTRQNGQQ